MAKHFITFGAGDKNYYEAGERLISQANEMNVFDGTNFYTDDDLKCDPDFWTKHSEFIQNNPRGYGYWLWKSYLIKKKMQQLNDGDILLYLDCGCELDIRKKGILLHFFELVKSSYIIGTSICNDIDWTKMDLILKLDMLQSKHLLSPQSAAGALLFCVCDKTRQFVNEWYEIGCEYHNIDDTPSMNKNFPSFKEHRHDQSIFSLLTKKYNLFSSDPSLHYCVEYRRNKTGISKLF